LRLHLHLHPPPSPSPRRRRRRTVATRFQRPGAAPSPSSCWWT
jgi:hypothetical protein